MKKVIIVIVLISSFAGGSVLGQGGNTGNFSNPGAFLGWDGTGTNQPLQIRNNFNQPINFFTNGVQGLSLTQLGFLGLNTTAPATLFHMDNGTFLATGTTGANPNLGAGTRMMWIPAPAAYRTGGKNVSRLFPLDGFSLEDK